VRAKNVKRTLKERFLDKVSPDAATGCWLWKGYISLSGYAVARVGKKNRSAHRISWVLFRGEIPAGLLVCHRCDVRACVNPDHLFLGTPAENSADMKRKGRNCFGENCPTARFNTEQVRKIKALLVRGEAVRAIARRWGVSESAIHHIKHGRTWRHIGPVHDAPSPGEPAE
jgi:HNH endonuclease